MFRFINRCKHSEQTRVNKSHVLSVEELELAEQYWIKVIQKMHYAKEISLIKKNKVIPKGSDLTALHPFVDTNRILRLSAELVIPISTIINFTPLYFMVNIRSPN